MTPRTLLRVLRLALDDQFSGASALGYTSRKSDRRALAGFIFNTETHRHKKLELTIVLEVVRTDAEDPVVFNAFVRHPNRPMPEDDYTSLDRMTISPSLCSKLEDIQPDDIEQWVKIVNHSLVHEMADVARGERWESDQLDWGNLK